MRKPLPTSTNTTHRERRAPASKLTGVRRLGPILLLALAAAGCGAHAPQGEEQANEAAEGGKTPVAAKTLRVGVAPVYPPLIFKRGANFVGLEVDFARALGSEVQREVKFVPLEWNDLIPALRDRRIDVIMSGMTVTDARKQQVSFAHPYMRVGQMALVRRKEASRLKASGALNAKQVRVGFITGTTGESYARNKLGKAQRKGFPDVAAGVAALRAGDLDAFVADSPAVWRVTSGVDGPEHQLTGIYEPMTEEYLAWAVRKEDNGLRDLLDTVLQQWHASGKLEEMMTPWIHVRGKKTK